MSRTFFASELEGVATWWRIERQDGVTLGFTSHDRDLTFDGVTYRAAPGVLPSAIRKTSGLSGDSAEMAGPLSHDSISSTDLARGRFDNARVSIGAVDWETLERVNLYNGSIGRVSEEADGFSAELLSSKEQLSFDHIPRTSPTCRAEFCGPGCTLSAARFSRECTAIAIDHQANTVTFDHSAGSELVYGQIRWLDGPQIGQKQEIVAVADGGVIVDSQIDPATLPGMRAVVREGCDHTIATCYNRFSNAVNFQGEPFLPGNDLLARYPTPAG
ncbi:DUF2163 domain-containing protein [Parerythrobacter jejuensis]|uniref:DUF2163 domain-containing protein n=1 Tax=Parerythrobacter jejuensis TaxID=795812 RepID=A0A845AWJ1_9SPHN|nr:DUF2163 domain-containing protein [Parerythrobacter jejuensis]MXP30765.1 DUF2163 domain-containing protein [Parerythrobacter jejuensis]MXP33525.1 DUF2163 domain-containing protein [Parerythrobacter jejuensis]